MPKEIRIMCFKRSNGRTTWDAESWDELVPSGEVLQNLGSLDKLTALSTALPKIIGLLSCSAYVNIVAAIYSCLMVIRGGDGLFSRTVWILSCILTSLGFVAVSVLLVIIASDVHSFIDSIAVMAYNNGTGQTFTRDQTLVVIIGFLSRVIYWLIIVLAYIVHVLMILASLTIAITAVVLGICTALLFDLPAGIPQIRQEDIESRATNRIPF